MSMKGRESRILSAAIFSVFAYRPLSMAVAPTSGCASAAAARRTGDQRHSFLEVKIAGHVYSLGRRRIAAGPSVAPDHPAVARILVSFAGGLPFNTVLGHRFFSRD